MKKQLSCIDCAVKSCQKGGGRYPDFCVTTHLDPQTLKDALTCYEEEENHRATLAAASVEYEHYCQYTRVEEIMDFARRIGAKKLGIATCVGLLAESRTLAAIFGSTALRCSASAARPAPCPRPSWELMRNAAPSAKPPATPSCRPKS